MAEIISINSSSGMGKNGREENFFKKLWGTFSSLDKFTKLFLLSMLLFLVAVPTITKEYFDTRQRASGKNFSPPERFKELVKAKYKSGEILVKFKSSRSEIKIKQESGANKESVLFEELDSATLPKSLIKVNEKYKIKNIGKVFKGKESKNVPESSLEQKKTNKDISRIYKLSFSEEIPVENVIRELEQNPDVEYAEPNYIFKANYIPNDPYYLDSYPSSIVNRDSNWNPSYDYQWGLKKIEMDKAWDLASGSASVIVAVTDTGVDYTHQELGNCNLSQVNSNQCSVIVSGYDFINNDNDPIDDNGHGTHVAGTIAAVSNNSFGIAGINYYAKIMPIKILDNEGSGSTSKISEGLVFAADKGARVINMSFGTSVIPDIPLVLKDALDYAFDKNVVLIAAAGNDNDDVYKGYYPAKYNRVISVASTNENDKKAAYSNYGKVEVAAPGGESSNILSLNAHNPSNPGLYLNLGLYPIGNGFLRLNGTSMAAPHAAGLASLLISKNSNLTNLEVKTIMENYADDLGNAGYDQYFGAGRINAEKAMNALNSNLLPPFGEVFSPEQNSYMGGAYDITGSVGGIAFSSYEIDIGSGENPSTWKTDGIVLTNNGTQPVSNGVIATFNTSFYEKSLWTLRLKVKGNNNLITERRVKVNIDPDLKAGWPKEIDGKSSGAVDQSYFLAEDLNNDGKKEIIAGSYGGYIYAWKNTGELLSGWPKYLGGNYGGDANSVMSVADLNKDGKKEIAIKAYYLNCYLTCIESNSLHLLNLNGEEVNSAWPKMGDYINPVIEDINNDGTLDIISYNFADNNLYFFSYEGDNMNYKLSSGGSKFISIGDLDNDGKKEIVFAKDSNILVYNNSGSLAWSKSVDFPETESTDVSWAKPTLADIDGDKKLEVIVGSGSERGVGKVWVFRNDGSNVPGWPQKDWINEGASNRANITVGDVDNDGILELVWGTESGRVLIYGADGNVKNILYGESAYSNFNRGIALADINSDGIQEILAGASRMAYDGGAFFAWDYRGNIISGWPKNVLTFSTPQITDLENDGKMDIIIYGKENLSTFDKIYIFGINSNFSTPDWPVFGFNERRTSSWKLLRNVPISTSRPTPTPTPGPTGYDKLPSELGKFVKTLSGRQSYIEVPTSLNNNSLNIQGSITIEAWVNFYNISEEHFQNIVTKLLQMEGGISDGLYSLDYHKSYDLTFIIFSKMDSVLKEDYGGKPAVEFQSNKWYHIAFTYENKRSKLYINGKLMSEGIDGKQTNNVLSYYSPLIVGGSSLESGIDELRISNIARDIPVNWQNNTYFKPLASDANTAALWHFENNLEDSSQYKNNGIAHGNISYIDDNLITPAPTSIPTNTPFSTPSPTPAPIPYTKLNLTLSLSGIGLNTGDNPNPVNKNRVVNVQVFNGNNVKVAERNVTVAYASASGKFKGPVNLRTTLPAGVYSVKLKVDKYLRRTINGIQVINGKYNYPAQTTLLPVDRNNDDLVNSSDYTNYTSCYNQKQTCAEINDDSTIDIKDYNLFYKLYFLMQGPNPPYQ